MPPSGVAILGQHCADKPVAEQSDCWIPSAYSQMRSTLRNPPYFDLTMHSEECIDLNRNLARCSSTRR